MNDFAAGIGWVVMVAGVVGVAAFLFGMSIEYAWEQFKKANGLFNIREAFRALREKKAAGKSAAATARLSGAQVRKLMQVAHKWAGPDENDCRSDELEMALREVRVEPVVGPITQSEPK